MIRLYALLQLSHRQKQQLASRWRSWRSRRAALSSTLVAARLALNEIPPPSFNINLSALLQIIDEVLLPGCGSDQLDMRV